MIGGGLVVAGCSMVNAGGESMFLDVVAALDEGERFGFWREDDSVTVVVGGLVLFTGDGAGGGACGDDRDVHGDKGGGTQLSAKFSFSLLLSEAIVSRDREV